MIARINTFLRLMLRRDVILLRIVDIRALIRCLDRISVCFSLGVFGELALYMSMKRHPFRC